MLGAGGNGDSCHGPSSGVSNRSIIMIKKLHRQWLNVSLHDGGVSGSDSDNPVQWIWYNKLNSDVSLIFVAVVQTL